MNEDAIKEEPIIQCQFSDEKSHLRHTKSKKAQKIIRVGLCMSSSFRLPRGLLKTILDLVFPDQTTTLKNNTCTYYI